MRLSIDQSRSFKSNEEKESKIKKKVDFKTIFGINIEKTNSKFINDAINDSKHSKMLLNNLNLDKLDELSKIRENIENLSPKTVSSHESDMEEIEDIDFNDPQSFLKAQLKIESKVKDRLDKRKIEK
jgi:hypothetical protein